MKELEYRFFKVSVIGRAKKHSDAGLGMQKEIRWQRRLITLLLFYIIHENDR
jgi:hypothetical protein